MTVCAACGRGAKRRHHPTARDENGDYLDPGLTWPFCHDDHTLAHDDRYTLGLELTEGPLTFLDRAELRLRRIAVDVTRLEATNPAPPLPSGFGEALTVWAGELSEGGARLNGRYPDWRSEECNLTRR